jgi:hypothetical protein
MGRALSGFSGQLAVVAVAPGGCGVILLHRRSGPAARAFIPRLLPAHQLAAGLALNRIGSQGARLAPHWAGWFRERWWGAALVLFGLSPDPWAGLALLILAGAADTVAVVSRSTIVQLHTPDELLGRVSAAGQIARRAGRRHHARRSRRGRHVGHDLPGQRRPQCIGAVALVGTTTPALRRFSAIPPAAPAGE